MDLFSNLSAQKKPGSKTVRKPKEEKVRYSFDLVLGQERVKTILTRVLETCRIATSYLFVGPQGCGKDAMALAFAAALNCTGTVRPCGTCKDCRQIRDFSHPDVKFLFAQPASTKEDAVIKHLQNKAENPYLPSRMSATASILIDQIRELKNAAALRRFSGRYRVFIISEAERMTLEAANSLLKLLEEPPERLVLILTTSRPDKLLPTITSRCQQVLFATLKHEDVEQKLVATCGDSPWTRIVARLSMGNLQKAFSMMDESFRSLRDLAYRLVQLRRDRDIHEKLDFVSRLTTELDRDGIRELFQLALFYLRDLMVFLNNPEDSVGIQQLYNLDQQDRIKELAGLYDTVTLEKTILETENCIDLIDKYIYINLVLLNYLIV